MTGEVPQVAGETTPNHEQIALDAIRAAVREGQAMDAAGPDQFKTGQEHLAPAFREVNWKQAFLAVAALLTKVEAAVVKYDEAVPTEGGTEAKEALKTFEEIRTEHYYDAYGTTQSGYGASMDPHRCGNESEPCRKVTEVRTVTPWKVTSVTSIPPAETDF